MEQIISELKNTAKNAAKKTGELLEVGKLKLACADTKSKINEAYKELGKDLYNAEKEGSEDAEAIKNIIIDIDGLYEKLAEQENQVAQLKKQKKCISCGQMCDDEADFCSKCGSKLE